MLWVGYTNDSVAILSQSTVLNGMVAQSMFQPKASKQVPFYAHEYHCGVIKPEFIAATLLLPATSQVISMRPARSQIRFRAWKLSR